MTTHRARWAAAAAALLLAGPAGAQGFFGPRQATSFQPELDAYYSLAGGMRLQAQVNPYFTPETSLHQVLFGAYAGWLVADVIRDLLSPDAAKSHVMDFRLGLLYTLTIDPGTTSSGDVWTVQGELTPRYDLLWGILASFRNRVSLNWQTGSSGGFFFRYRGRVQLEREFAVGPVPLTPYVNTELFWQQAPAMWTQFRLQAGLVVGFRAFARGQSVELNYSAVTMLQPSRSWYPLWGLVLSSYFD